MDDQKLQLKQLKEEIMSIQHTMDVLHKEEAAILSEIDRLERAAKERGLHMLQNQLLAAFTLLVAAGALLAQVSVDLQVPPTVFQPVLEPQEQPNE